MKQVLTEASNGTRLWRKSRSPLTCCLQALPIVSDLHWVPDSQVQESPKKAALVSHGWWRIKCNLLSFALLFSPWTLPTGSCLASQSAVSHLSNQTNRNFNDWSDTTLLHSSCKDQFMWQRVAKQIAAQTFCFGLRTASPHFVGVTMSGP